jgi:hypothetical protein
MTTAVTYDMQKLHEAVSSLATGNESLQERLRHAMIPLLTLHHGGGMKNKKRAPELAAIIERLSDGNLERLDNEQARELASKIVSLENSNWHDAVWALEDSMGPESTP